jgi:glycosyltransferase involved in cell wall biosynthesis
MRRLRVVQLISGLAIGPVHGGAELYGLRLAQALDPRRFEVVVLALWTHFLPIENHYAGELHARGIPLHACIPFHTDVRVNTLHGYVATLHHIRALRPDILHTHTEFCDLIGVALRRTAPVGALVRTAHNMREWRDLGPWRGRTEVLYPLLCDAEAGVSPAVVELLDTRPAARLLRKRAHYIPGAVSAAHTVAHRSPAEVRAALGIPPGAPLFGTLGRLDDQKGLPYLFEAMALVREQLPQARLVVVGNGERAEAYRALIRERGQHDYVTLLGPRPDAFDIVAALDVFVSASLWEGLPAVITEAMLLGTPVVATNVAGSRNLMTHRVTGLLSPPRAPAPLAAAMIEQYTERATAQRMAATAREVARQFTFESVAEQYTALYEQLART